MTVAALFVDPKGIYPQLLPPQHCWDEKRDARRYIGFAPVVAHPPCQLWGNFAAANYGRYGKHIPAWKPGGRDGGCFEFALSKVRSMCGVLEHPATSHAWAFYLGDEGPSVADVGWVESSHPQEWYCAVAQSAYGHRCQKLTGLVYVGERPPFELLWARPEGTHQIGYRDKRGKAANKPTVSKREASATPVAFARTLIALAEWSRG